MFYSFAFYIYIVKLSRIDFSVFSEVGNKVNFFPYEYPIVQMKKLPFLTALPCRVCQISSI